VAESTQHKLDRIRPPRVQITYDVETGGAIEQKELPFIVGIMADLSGHPAEELPKVKDRKFVEIDRDNFNDVMESIAPRLEVSVPNRLKGDGNMRLELNFRNMDDFGPLEIVKQIDQLRALHDARQRLSDLLTKLDGNEDLEELLRAVAANPDNQSEIRTALAAPNGSGGGNGAGGGAVAGGGGSAAADEDAQPGGGTTGGDEEA
jgi:type VI secretion system protein ImpB